VAIAGKTGQGVASKWASQLSNAASGTAQTPGSIVYGVNAYVAAGGNPMLAAAKNPQKWVNGVNAAQQKWQARLQAVGADVGNWSGPMIGKGVARIAGGAQEASAPNGKFTTFMTALLQYETTALVALNASNPRGDLNTNITRAGVWMTKMAGFRSQNPTY
jgi:hypothetical protein